MGLSINNQVSIICDADESAWLPVGIGDEPIGSYSYEWLPQEGNRVVSKQKVGNIINEATISQDGKLIQLDSGGFGVIAIDTIALPKTTRVIVRSVSHLQGDDFHFVEAVKAPQIATHDWSCENKETNQVLAELPPPADWEGDSDAWYASKQYRQHFDGFSKHFESIYKNLLKVLSLAISPTQMAEYRTITDRVCEGNTGWWRDIAGASVALAFQGKYTDANLRQFVELGSCFYQDDFTFEISQQQAVKALMEIAKEKSKEMTPEKLWEAQELLDVFTCNELIRIVQNKPKHKPLFYKWLWREEMKPEEALLDNPDLYEMYREELIADREKVMEAFGTDGLLVVDYRDQVRNSLMREDGWALDETNEFEENEKRIANL
jgi:hypothetical protein